MGKEFRFSMEHNHLIAGVLQHPRVGWDECFRFMAERGEDQLFDEEAVNQACWDDEEWEW